MVRLNFVSNSSGVLARRKCGALDSSGARWIELDAPAAAALPEPIVRSQRSLKIQDWHLERLAVVYVRQSNPQQVFDHR